MMSLRPMFGARPGDYALGALLFAPAYLGLAGALVIHPHLTLPHRWRKSMLGVVAAASFLYLITGIGVIGVFGAEFSLLYTWPNQAVVQRIAIPLALFEQVGLLFFGVWLAAFTVTVAFFIHIAHVGLAQLVPVLAHRLVPIGLAAGLWLGGVFIPNWTWVRHGYETVRVGALCVVFLYPLLLVLVAVWRKKGAVR